MGSTVYSNKIKKRVYQQLHGKVDSSEKPDREKKQEILEQHWDTGKSHNKDPEWLKEVRPEKEWKKTRRHTNNH